MSRRIRSALLGFCSAAALGGVTAPVAEAAEPQVRYLASVSCPTATSCFAVGASGDRPLIEHWNGSTWSVVRSPVPAGASGAVLVDVSCAASDRCVAVGYTSTQAVLVEHWNGRKWTIRSTPGASNESSVGGVSCATPSECVVVGVTSVRGKSGPFASHWNGTRWARMKMPATSHPVLLLGVSCPDRATCVAVGWRQLPLSAGTVRPMKADLRTFALLWERGAGWSTMSTPRPAGESVGMLFDVACPSATLCHAVGRTGDKHQILSRNGTKWSVNRLTPRAMSYLTGISCPTTSTCFGVGAYNSPQLKTRAERWDGTAWSFTPSPNVGGSDSTLSGVSCVSPSSCHAVGYSSSTDAGEARPLTARWDGTRWLRS